MRKVTDPVYLTDVVLATSEAVIVNRFDEIGAEGGLGSQC
jgi:hypothetical protein